MRLTPQQLADIRERIKNKFAIRTPMIVSLLEHITALEADAAMDRGRSDAKIAVLTSVLAKLAREGQQEYAQKMLKKSDKAWVDVKPEHLVVAHVNKQEQGR